ncbi:hypothetical protein ACIPEN_11165 [Herbaspirillum chlorophenolicum]|uniref:Uncharacterized protein n=1 Tax=Herbaspirillum chlorophenolicum TaxID=211589 RepID=A0ABW8EZC0_9BURK|nr:hypothetical protein [Herbaspirillum chlorophenolicum]
MIRQQQRTVVRLVFACPANGAGDDEALAGAAFQAAVGGLKRLSEAVANKKANPSGFAFLLERRIYNSVALTG